MADTYSSGRGGGRDGGHGDRRSGKHDGGRNGGRNGKRKSRRNGAAREQQNDGGGANGQPDEPDVEEECAHPSPATPLHSADRQCRITLPGNPIIPFLANQQMWNGERYGMPEGGPGNGYVLSLSCCSSWTR